MPLEDPVKVLKEARVVAVVGASRNPEKDAYRVPAYLQSKGYKVIPINPKASEILGEKAYPSLDALPDDLAREVDVVDVFRPPEEAVNVVEQAIRLKERTGKDLVVWFQFGTSSDEAVEKALKAGLRVVRERCMMQELKRMLGEE
ncbi:MAG: CoA-binding protein [Desulfurococcales archaeon]|nr:CoA-binding protein [Desulfurococcales archaeon]